MKQIRYLCCLLALLTSCKKEPSTPTQPLAMSALVNGQPWKATAGVYPAVAQLDPAHPGTASQYEVLLSGGSADFLPLGLKTFTIRLGANYLPKVGRHPINYGDGGFIGPVNPNYRQLAAVMAFELPTTQTYVVTASSGFLEITAVTDTQVTGTFELMGKTSQPANGAPIELHITQGKFCAQLIGTGGKPVPWNEEQ